MNVRTAYSRMKWPYALIAVIAAAAAAYGLIHGGTDLAAASASGKKPGATDRIKASPPPQLFTATQVTPLDRKVVAERAIAAGLIARWRKDHGAARDDKAFTAWVAAQVPPPPPHTHTHDQGP